MVGRPCVTLTHKVLYLPVNLVNCFNATTIRVNLQRERGCMFLIPLRTVDYLVNGIGQKQPFQASNLVVGPRREQAGGIRVRKAFR